MRSMVETTFRYRGLWMKVVLAVVGLTVLYVIVMPRVYMSEMDVLVQNKRGDEQITPNRNTGTVTVNEVTEEQINSEIQMLKSRSLADLVVDPLWESRDMTKLTQAQLKAHDKAVDYFEKHLSADMIRKSNVIHVTYTASDPKTATETLNRLMQSFLTKQRAIAQPPGTVQFFTDQANKTKTQLNKAQLELAQYQQQHQIVNLTDSEQNIDRQINDAQTELRSTDAQISEISQRIGTQTAQLRAVPNRQMTQERTLPNDYSVERLNTMLAELQNRRTSLLTKFTSQDRLVQEIDRQIADTKAALSNAQHMTSQERSTDVNPVWQTVTGSIIQDQAARQALKAKHDALTEQIANLRKGLSGVEDSTVDFTTLKQRVTDLETNYQLYTQKRDEAMMADSMNENRLLNVAIEQTPTFSVTPYRPKPLVDLALGTFTAMFLASFMVFFAEMGRGTIATAVEIERMSRLPVLATVPMDRMLEGRSAGRLGDAAPVFIGMGASRASGEERGLSRRMMRYQYRKESSAL